MNIVFSKHIIKINFIILSLFVLTNCQLKSPNKTHGINYLENREKALFLDKSNKNDVIKIIGRPHYKSIKSDDIWFYVERQITRGELHKLGRNILEKNNVLELKFNNYGILNAKKLYTKEDMKKVLYSKNSTENSYKGRSFVSSFLSSVRQKMYGKKKF